MEPPNTVLFWTPTGSMALERPMECPACHAMHYFVRNRYGRTLCLSCSDAEKERIEP